MTKDTPTSILTDLRNIVGAAHVVTGTDAARWSEDWTRQRQWAPLAVIRPANTAEVAKVVQLANRTSTVIVPVSGNTGLVEGTYAQGALMLSLDRMSAIRTVKPEARIAIVEAGAILSHIHDAADAHDLIFPLYFGARGSAMRARPR